MFVNAKDLLKECERSHKGIAEIALEEEMERSRTTREEILAGLSQVIEVMRSSSEEALHHETHTVSGLIGGEP